MTDPILPFLAADAVALLLLGCFGGLLPRALPGLATAGFCGIGALLCLPPLLMADRGALTLPVGPPGLSLHIALDALSALFGIVLFVCGTAVAVQASAQGSAQAPTHQTTVGPRPFASAIPLILAGAFLTLVAADAVTLAIGIILTGGALWQASELARPRQPRPIYAIAAASLLVIALSLLAPVGFAPDFDVIRTAPDSSGRLAQAALLTAAAVLAVLVCAGSRADTHDQKADHAAQSDALTAGAVIPVMLYLLIRLLLDLPGPAIQAWWGFFLLAAGAALSLWFGWQAVRHPDLPAAILSLVRQQAGLAVIGLGLTGIAKAADLPISASSGLAATLLLSMTAAVAGTLACLASQAINEGAGTVWLARLGGLIHTMPATSAALAAALFALSALPSGAGFAAVWLLFQSLLSAPRTGGLISQVPMAITAAVLALSAALSTAACIRLAGIVILSRPRGVRGSAARDVTRAERPALFVLAAVSLLLGALPGVVLNALAAPATATLTGSNLTARFGWMILSSSASAPGYAPLPVLALLALLTGAVILLTRQARSVARVTALWNDGQSLPETMPFGDPMAQSAGAGFLPALPDLPRRPTLPQISLRPLDLLTRPSVGIWALLLGIGVLLLVLSLSEAASPA